MPPEPPQEQPPFCCVQCGQFYEQSPANATCTQCGSAAVLSTASNDPDALRAALSAERPWHHNLAREIKISALAIGTVAVLIAVLLVVSMVRDAEEMAQRRREVVCFSLPADTSASEEQTLRQQLPAYRPRLAQQIESLRPCFQTLETSMPKGSGEQILLEVSIDETGTIGEVDTVNAQTLADLAGCIVEHVRDWRLPPRTVAGSVILRVPVSFFKLRDPAEQRGRILFPNEVEVVVGLEKRCVPQIPADLAGDPDVGAGP